MRERGKEGAISNPDNKQTEERARPGSSWEERAAGEPGMMPLTTSPWTDLKSDGSCDLNAKERLEREIRLLRFIDLQKKKVFTLSRTGKEGGSEGGKESEGKKGERERERERREKKEERKKKEARLATDREGTIPSLSRFHW